ncbi:MAG TPA: hypothetical protein ENN23_06440 [Deltaproteobacteria bacterium]|nr:hypothetical protein [Deltaproteobacteria bacterium]
MKIAVINGSPKGQVSVTMQYARFLQLKFPRARFEYFDVAQKINKLEGDKKEFEKTIRRIKSANAVLWAFPLYFFLVSSQYKRFIELIFERRALAAFRGKPAAVLTTSINFFDSTAQIYMNGICDDLGMKYFGAYSAEMNDMHKSAERKRLAAFGELFLAAVRKNEPAHRNYPAVVAKRTAFQPGRPKPIKAGGKKVLIIADDIEKSANLKKMVKYLRESFSPAADLVQLKDIDIKGGCLGCMQCGMDNVCVYEGKDGFVDFFNNQVKAADILFFAGAVRDRYLSSSWKCFFDRSFFKGHTPALKGRQIGFVISGPLGQITNLREMMKAYIEMQSCNLIGFVSDDAGTSGQLSAALQNAAGRAVDFASRGYIQPPTFYSVGGGKIFRDAVYSRLRPVFQADHRYYKEHGFYNFPQKNYKWRLINNTLILLLKIPRVRREFLKRMKVEMTRHFDRYIKKPKQV